MKDWEKGSGYVKDILDIDPIGNVAKLFNWDVTRINGHDNDQIVKALNTKTSKPHFIVADTIKSQTYGDSVIHGIEDMIDKLSSLKEEVSTVALNKLWTSNTDTIEPFSNSRLIIDLSSVIS